MKNQPAYVFTLLCVMFLLFSFSIYIQPFAGTPAKNDRALKAGQGKLVWQKYNCQSCHQLYGLGGYLGPDLTNCYSMKGKGENYIKAILSSGTAQMPSFSLSMEEEEQLIEFLRSADSSGSADPRNFTIMASGMIRRK